MQDYVHCAVQIEPELVGGKLVAGHPVGLEAVLEFRYHLLHASPLAVAIRIYEAGALPLEVRHDISDICSEIVHLDFDHNSLLMLPGSGLVHKRMEYTHFFTGGLVGGNRSVKPVCRYPFEFHIPCKSGDEVDAVLTVCGPVHEVVGAEVGVASDYYLSVFPLFAELEYQPLEKACNVDRLVSPGRPEDGKDELSAAAFEQKQRHIAVFPVIGVEQRELLRTVCVGIRIIGIDNDGFWLRVIRGDEVIDEGLSDIEQFLAGQAVLQTSHRRLGSKVNLVRSRPAGTHLQDTVTTEPVAIVGIFEAGHYLVYSLAEHFRLAVYNHRFPAGGFDAGFDAFYDAA